MNERTFNYYLKNIHEQKCFNKLYNYYYRRIAIHIDGKYKLGALSEDVVQETFMNLLALKEYKHIEHFTSWLYKIAENIALRKLGKENSERKKIYYGIEDEVEEKIELFGGLQKSVEKMDKVSQRIFYYRYVEAYSLKEIAELLNLTYDNVRKKHSRGIKFLRKKEKVSHFMLLNVFI